MSKLIKVALIIGIIGSILWGIKYSITYVPWKNSVVKLMPASIGSAWTARLLEHLLRENINPSEWERYELPEPGKQLSDWFLANTDQRGITYISSLFEEGELDKFVRACRSLEIEFYVADKEQGRVEVYIMGLNRGRKTLYYRSKPITFTTNDTYFIDKIEEKREEFTKALEDKRKYLLFNF